MRTGTVPAGRPALVPSRRGESDRARARVAPTTCDRRIAAGPAGAGSMTEAAGKAASVRSLVGTSQSVPASDTDLAPAPDRQNRAQ